VSSAPSPLSPRLAALAEAVRPGSRVADIGSDHGQLPLWLAASGRAAFCLATERTEEILARVARPDPGEPWADRLAYRAGDGLEPIAPADRIDTVVVAGLGGRTILRMLARGLPRRPEIERLVLQPRAEPASARSFLHRHGWALVAERLTEDGGRLHLTIAAEPGVDPAYEDDALSAEDLYAAGPLLVRSGRPEVAEAWRRERERLGRIVARGGSGASMERARAGLARAERILDFISKRAG
jgi:tRNA (adenine22-N1)-methyltransferase